MSFQWNIYEKSFTPYHAQLAPKRYVHRHKIERQVSRVSRTFQDSKVKSTMRFLRKYVLSNTRYFHFSVLLFAFFFDEAIKNTLKTIYISRNYEVRKILFLFLLFHLLIKIIKIFKNRYSMD